MSFASWLCTLRRSLQQTYGPSRRPPRRRPLGIPGRGLLLEILEDRTLPSTVSWINPAGGDWDTASNWSTGQVPGQADDVVINQTGITVTHSTNASEAINSLSSQASINWQDGSLTLASASLVTGAFDNAGTVTIQGGALKLWGGGTSTGAFTVSAGATLSFDLATTLGLGSSVSGNGAVAFYGDGGAIAVQGGYAVGAGGSTTLVGGAQVTFGGAVQGVGGALTVRGNATFTGPVGGVGSVTIDHGTLDLSAAALPPGPLALPALSLNVGTLALPAGQGATVAGALSATGGPDNVRGGGTLTLGGASTIRIGGNGDDLYVDGDVVNAGTLTLAGDSALQLGAGRTFTNAPAGTVVLDGEEQLGYYPDAGFTFVNQGALVAVPDGTYATFVGATLVNQATGTIHAEAGVPDLVFNAGATVSGQPGVTTVVGDPGTTLVFDGLSLDASASLQADAVDLRGTNAIAGSYQAATSTEVANGTATFTGVVAALGSVSISQNSILDLTAATLAPAARDLPSLAVTGGTLRAAGAWTASGPVSLVGKLDAAGGSGSLTAAGGADIDGAALSGYTLVVPQGQSATLERHGTVLADGSVLDNQGTLTVNGAEVDYDGSAAQLKNEGTLHSNQTSLLFVPIDSPGDIVVDGGLLDLGHNDSPTSRTAGTFGGRIDATQATALWFSGQVTLAPASSVDATAVTFYGPAQVAGSYQAASTAAVGGAGAPVTFTGTVKGLGALYVASGTTANFSAAAPVTLSATSIDLAGTLGGSAFRVINDSGNYTQEAGSTLNVKLGGPTAGTQYDQLNVAGTASLASTLNLSIVPSVGDICGGTFTVINAAPLTGSFATINGLVQPGGQTLTPTYSSNSLTIAASQFASTTTVAASADPSILNQAVTFTATVSAPAGATEVPTGAVQFQIDGANYGSPVALSGGQANISLSSLAVGPHSVTALYSGDDCFYASAGSLTQQVDYRFSGFLPPLNSNLSFGLNRTIPVKFQLTDYNGNFITSLSAVTSLQVLNSQGTNVLTNAGSTALRYDSTSNQFVANWQTKGLPAGSYTVQLKLADGATQTKTVQLTANGGGANAQAADGSDVSAGNTAGQLLGGDVEVYVNDSNGALTPDELARIGDAITAVDAVTAPYGVTVEETTDPSQAEVTLDMAATSPVGGAADGILGCFDPASGQIALIQGWDWYAGADPTQVGSGQYDFQTTVTHELGHALGLGESTNPASAMYGTLAPGTAVRTLTTADLNVPYDEAGADAQRAAPLPVVVADTSSTAAAEAVPNGPVLAGSPANPPKAAVPLGQADAVSLETAHLAAAAGPTDGMRERTEHTLSTAGIAPARLRASAGNPQTIAMSVPAWGKQLPGVEKAGGEIGGDATVFVIAPGARPGSGDAVRDAFFRTLPHGHREPMPSAAGASAGVEAVIKELARALTTRNDGDAGEAPGPAAANLVAGGPVLFALLGTTWASQAEQPDARRQRRRWQG